MTRLIVLALTLIAFMVPAAYAAEWRQYKSPEVAGWDSAKLEAARSHAESLGSAAVMIVDDGHVVAAWGQVERRFRTASVRKSLVSALYGVAVARGDAVLSRTLEDLGIDDLQPLTAVEKQATVRDLLSSRSGVFHPAAKVTPSQVRRRPARGAHRPGTFWFYNNWDFNLAGELLARFLGRDLGAAFDLELARPLQMQDFRPEDFFWEPEPRVSQHPAFEFRISARDLARLGQLYLDGGRWRGRSVIPSGWVRESTRSISDFGDGSGYGFMWWINPEISGRFDRAAPGAKPRGSFAASGAGGHVVWVWPAQRVVIVHRGDTDGGEGVSEEKVLALIETIVSAKSGKRSKKAALITMRAQPFANALPPYEEPRPIALDPAAMDELKGFYLINPQLNIELFEHQGTLFAAATGRPEVILHSYAKDRFFSRSVPLRIEVERDASGKIVAMNAELRGRKMRGVRQPVQP